MVPSLWDFYDGRKGPECRAIVLQDELMGHQARVAGDKSKTAADFLDCVDVVDAMERVWKPVFQRDFGVFGWVEGPRPQFLSGFVVDSFGDRRRRDVVDNEVVEHWLRRLHFQFVSRSDRKWAPTMLGQSHWHRRNPVEELRRSRH